MTGWRVVPGGVQAVIVGVDNAALPIAATLKSLSDHLQSAVDGTQSAEVAQAMKDFVDAQVVDLTTIEQRIPAAKDAVIAATNAVTAGDFAMAQATQAQAAAAWSTPLVSGKPGVF